jgi:hypothetical protein
MQTQRLLWKAFAHMFPAVLSVCVMLLAAGEVHRQGHHGDLISLNQTLSVL